MPYIIFAQTSTISKKITNMITIHKNQAFATFKWSRAGSSFIIMAADRDVTYQVSYCQWLKRKLFRNRG